PADRPDSPDRRATGASGPDHAPLAVLNQKQRWIFQQAAQFLQILCAKGAIDHPVIAAHRDRHSMTGNDLIAIVDRWNLVNFANGKNETLRWINHRRKTVDPHAAKIRNRERAALKFFRLHSLVSRAMSQIFRRFA